ncbi:MAG TPA: UDP-forming cellulose synthase catalytic subunit [Methylophaga sp.]|nr:UDP-forming cellulose synthase catalytic subunit [Methylophaga sp.]
MVFSTITKHLRFGFWLLLILLLINLSWVSVSYHAQLIVSAFLLGGLLLVYNLSRVINNLNWQQWFRLLIIFITIFLTFRYMHWRATESLPMQFGLLSMICGLLLFLAEAYGLVNMLFGFFINAQPYHRKSLPLPADPAQLPVIDVYIPTYNEDPSVTRPTVIAATQMDYPADKLHVYILDDGGTVQKCQDVDAAKAQAAQDRAAVLKDIAAEFGAGYLTRERNLHAKSGNINSALSYTCGDLLLILDCDHIPTRDFLQQTVGLFLADPKLFVVQTPHNFVSPDPLERNLQTYEQSPAENELFYDVMQPGLDSWGTSFFCGSAAILRRSVIDELGGVSGQTITEDAETTLDAMSRGYGSAYLNKPMVSGLQPETYAGFVVQRVRWGQGMLQIFILKNPWRVPGLKLVQRLLYTNFAFYWGFASARVIMLLAPPMFLVFSINLCDATAIDLISYAGPCLLAALLSTQYFYGRVRWPFMSQLYEVIQSVYVTLGLIEVVRKPRSPSFKVTPKGEQLNEDYVSSLTWPFYLFLGFTSLGIVMGIHRYLTEPFGQAAVAFVMFWAVLDVMLLLGALGVMLERKQLRQSPRAPHDEKVQMQLADGTALTGECRNASAGGAGLLLTGQALNIVRFKKGSDVQLWFPDRSRPLSAKIINLKRHDKNTLQVGLAYQFSCVEDERMAIDIAFGSSQQLLQNNQRRHQGRSIVHGFWIVVSLGFIYGLAHLRFLLSARRGGKTENL